MQIIDATKTEINFVVWGQPCPWAVYTKQGPEPIGFLKMRAWQGLIIETAREAMKGRPLFTGPIHLEVSFRLGYPLRAPKGAAARQRWTAKHLLMKPDNTNLLKAFEDALTGHIWQDDSQVVQTIANKEFRDNAFTIATIRVPVQETTVHTHTHGLSGGER